MRTDVAGLQSQRFDLFAPGTHPRTHRPMHTGGLKPRQALEHSVFRFPGKGTTPPPVGRIPNTFCSVLFPITVPPAALGLGLGDLPSSLSRSHAGSKDKGSSGLSTGLCPPAPSGTTKATCRGGNLLSPASEGAGLRSLTHAPPPAWRLCSERAAVRLGGRLSTLHPSAVWQAGICTRLCTGAGERWRGSGGGGFSYQRLHVSVGEPKEYLKVPKPESMLFRNTNHGPCSLTRESSDFAGTVEGGDGGMME